MKMRGSAMVAPRKVRTKGMVAVDGHVSHSPPARRGSGHAVFHVEQLSLGRGVYGCFARWSTAIPQDFGRFGLSGSSGFGKVDERSAKPPQSEAPMQSSVSRETSFWHWIETAPAAGAAADQAAQPQRCSPKRTVNLYGLDHVVRAGRLKAA